MKEPSGVRISLEKLGKRTRIEEKDGTTRDKQKNQ